MLFYAPGRTKEFNPFLLQRTFYGAYDENVCLDWSSDSRVLAAGSRDMCTRVYAAEHFVNLNTYNLGGHSETIVGCFFELNSLNMYTVGRNGRLNVWECDTKLNGLIPFVEEEEEPEDDEDEFTGKSKKKEVETTEDGRPIRKIYVNYRKTAKHAIRDALEANVAVGLLSCDYNKHNKILVCGFSNGSFLLHELPQFNLIHSLR